MNDLILDLTKKKEFNIRIEYEDDNFDKHLFEGTAVITAKLLDIQASFDKKLKIEMSSKQKVTAKTSKEGFTLGGKEIVQYFDLEEELNDEIIKASLGEDYKEFKKMLDVGKKTGDSYESIKKSIIETINLLLKELSEEELSEEEKK